MLPPAILSGGFFILELFLKRFGGMVAVFYHCDVLAMLLHIKHHKMTTLNALTANLNFDKANEVMAAMKAKGITCEIDGDKFGYRRQTRYYWFYICHSGNLVFCQCYSQNTGKKTRNWKTRHAAYQFVEKTTGIKAL